MQEKLKQVTIPNIPQAYGTVESAQQQQQQQAGIVHDSHGEVTGTHITDQKAAFGLESVIGLCSGYDRGGRSLRSMPIGGPKAEG